MARKSSAKRSARRTRRSSPKRSGRKVNAYAKFVKAHYAGAKRSAGKGAKSTTVFKKLGAMWRKSHKKSSGKKAKRHSKKH